MYVKRSLFFGKNWSKMDKKKFESVQKKLFLKIFKDLKDEEKSRLFAQILAGLILLSTKISNASKSDTKSREVTA